MSWPRGFHYMFAFWLNFTLLLPQDADARSFDLAARHYF